MFRSIMVLCTTIGFAGTAMTAAQAGSLRSADQDLASLEVSAQANNKQRANKPPPIAKVVRTPSGGGPKPAVSNRGGGNKPAFSGGGNRGGGGGVRPAISSGGNPNINRSAIGTGGGNRNNLGTGNRALTVNPNVNRNAIGTGSGNRNNLGTGNRALTVNPNVNRNAIGTGSGNRGNIGRHGTGAAGFGVPGQRLRGPALTPPRDGLARPVLGPGPGRGLAGPGMRQGMRQGMRGPGLRPVGPPRFMHARLNGGRYAAIYRGPRPFYYGGRWRRFVPITVLGAVAIGGAYYYPDAYVAAARPACGGFTPDGCRLNWQQSNFEDGGSEWQCVQYCPRPNAPPPPQAVALVEPPPPPQGGTCEVTIYSEPGLAGPGVTTSDEQPKLSESGMGQPDRITAGAIRNVGLLHRRGIRR